MVYDLAYKYGYELSPLCAVLYYFIHIIIINCRGIPGGEENGRRGYAMTFVIAYVRVSIDF